MVPRAFRVLPLVLGLLLTASCARQSPLSPGHGHVAFLPEEIVAGFTAMIAAASAARSYLP